MRYLVVRKPTLHTQLESTTFTEMVSARSTLPPAHAVDRADLSASEAADERNNPAVDCVVLAVPFTLIEPVTEAAPSAEPSAWGIDAVGAEASGCTGKGVTVAVLDTGIDRAHEAFGDLTFAPADLRDFTTGVEGGVPGTAEDERGHGTHVAATLFGGTVAGQRVGVAPGVRRALVGKIIGDAGATTDAIYDGIDWAIRERADVICLSLGIDFPRAVARLIAENDLPPDIAESLAFEAFRDNVRLFDRQLNTLDARSFRGREALLVAATGNSSRRHENPTHTMAAVTPASSDGFIAVGAVGRTGPADAPYQVARFSNTGPTLVGPGVSILSAKRGGGVASQSGTSMAVPHAAGVIALWIERLQNGSAQRSQGWAEEVAVELRSHARPLPGQARRDVGRGLVQAPPPR